MECGDRTVSRSKIHMRHQKNPVAHKCCLPKEVCSRLKGKKARLQEATATHRRGDPPHHRKHWRKPKATAQVIFFAAFWNAKTKSCPSLTQAPNRISPYRIVYSGNAGNNGCSRKSSHQSTLLDEMKSVAGDALGI